MLQMHFSLPLHSFISMSEDVMNLLWCSCQFQIFRIHAELMDYYCYSRETGQKANNTCASKLSACSALSVLLPLFLPSDMRIDTPGKLLRATMEQRWPVQMPCDSSDFLAVLL